MEYFKELFTFLILIVLIILYVKYVKGDFTYKEEIVSENEYCKENIITDTKTWQSKAIKQKNVKVVVVKRTYNSGKIIFKSLEFNI